MSDLKSNPDIVDQIAESFAPAPTNLVRQMFNSAGMRAPEVIWSPSDIELRSHLLRQFAATCRVLARDDGTLSDAPINLDHFGDLKDWIMMIEPVQDAKDFRYTYYGKGIAQNYGRDMTGRRASEFGGHVATFFAGLYSAMLKRGETVFSEHEPPQNVFVRVWQRYIVPRIADDGTVVGFLAMNVPENELRAGLELMIDPVLVLTDAQQIVYANRAAQTAFNLPLVRGQEAFGHATGMSLDTSRTPAEFLTQNRVEDSVQLTIRDTIVERLVMTVSAAQYKGIAYYIVVMRLIGT